MIEPVLMEDTFLNDVFEAGGLRDTFQLWWLGQSGYLVQYQNHHILLDPYLSFSLEAKYANTDKPHVRMTDLVINPDRLRFIEAATSTHNHTDHLDADTLLPIMEWNREMKLIIPEANRDFVVERLQCDRNWPIGLTDGQSTEVGLFQFTAVPAAHEEIETDEQGRHKHLGYIVQFGPYTIYFSGDTVRYEGMVERLRQFEIDVAILPINGSKPERRVPGNLNGEEAAQLAKEIEAKLTIPCHYHMFEFNSVEPETFTKPAERLGINYRILQAGERWCSSELPS